MGVCTARELSKRRNALFKGENGEPHGTWTLTSTVMGVPRTQKAIPVLFEAIDGKFAVTVLGQTAVHDSGIAETIFTKMRISFYPPSAPMLIGLDDVKVWEAVPKDEDEKKRKK